MTGRARPAEPNLRTGTPRGRWVIAVAVLGSGVAFLDGTVVNVALPAIASDLDSSLSDLQWVLTGYLLTLGSLLVIGGSLGDLFGRRRMFVAGLAGFGAASFLCGLAPSNTTLIVARCIQGMAAALLVPGSLAIISASFCPDHPVAPSSDAVTRKVDTSGSISFAAATYRVGSAYARQQVQVAIVDDQVQIAYDGKLIRTHPIRHDPTRQHGALANPAGRPNRSNAA